MGKFKHKVSCPKCGSRDNVGVYLDGDVYNGKCFGCGTPYHDIDLTDPRFDHHLWPGGMAPGVEGDFEPEQNQQVQTQTYFQQQEPEETVDDILQYPINAVPERWDLEDAKYYQVRTRYDSNGQPRYIYYPHWRDGKVAYFKRRDLSDKGQMKVIGSTANFPDLFGMYGVPEGVPCVILTEGEDDAGAARKIFRQYGKNFPCVSIPTGATIDPDSGEGIIDKPLQRALPKVAAAKVVYLCLDQDTPGMALNKALAEELATHTEVRVMRFSEKDAREMVRAGKQQEFWDAFITAPVYIPESIVWAGDIDIEEITTPLREGIPLPLPELQAKMHGLRYGPDAGELTILTGGSGVGKSTLLRVAIKHALDNRPSLKGAMIYLEEQMKKTVQSIAAFYYSIPLPQLRANPNMLTHEQWQACIHHAYGNRLAFVKHFGSMSTTKLLNKCYHLHRMGVELIGLDHISMVVAGQNASRGGERKDIDQLMEGLANFVTTTGCHVIAVVHLKRGDRKLVKNSEGEYNLDIAPYDKGGVISKTDLRGSGGIEQMSFNIWAVEGDVYGDTGMFSPLDRWVRILKNREWNELGLAGMYQMDLKTGLLVPKRCTR